MKTKKKKDPKPKGRKPGRPAAKAVPLDRADKAEMRKRVMAEIRDKHPGTESRLTAQQRFHLETNELWQIDKVRIAQWNMTRGSIENSLLAGSPRWPEVVEMRRQENVEDKEEMGRRKRRTAKLVKEVLAELLGMTEEEAVAFVYDLTVVETEKDPGYLALELATKRLLQRCDDHMSTLGIYGTKADPGWLRSQRGIGVKLAAKLLYVVKDHQRFRRPSSLWSYMGVGDASRENRQKGVQLKHNPKGRSLSFVIADSLLKQNSEPWRRIYDERYAHTLITHPEWHGVREEGSKNMHPGHANKDARRVMVKAFYREFWLQCWLADGKMAPSKPYEKAEAA